MASAEIRRVAVVGVSEHKPTPTMIHPPILELTRSKPLIQGTGNIGKPIVQELASQGFHVSILSRGSKHDNVPEGVAVKTVDYDDIESLKSALAGQDAVVSAIASVAVSGQQQRLADAALGKNALALSWGRKKICRARLSHEMLKDFGPASRRRQAFHSLRVWNQHSTAPGVEDRPDRGWQDQNSRRPPEEGRAEPGFQLDRDIQRALL